MNSFQQSLIDRGLTKREAAVTEAALQGKTNPQIAADLNLKTPTVKYHMYNVFKTLNIKTRLSLSNLLMLEYIEFKKTQAVNSTPVE